MKSLKTIIAASLLALGSASAFAQATYTDAEGNEYEFKKHFFLDLQGGAQYTLGEAKFKDLISPNVQLGLGYQFSPVFGMRLQANGWQSKGGWNGYTGKDGHGNALYADYKYNYVAPGVDFMFNLSNLICGWNPNRVFNVTAFVGGGANIAWGNDEVNEIAEGLNKTNYLLDYLWDGTKVRAFGRAGIDLNFKVSKAVSIMVEGNANITTDGYNSKKAENPDWYFNALVGLRINLGKSYVKKEKPVEPAPEPVQQYIEPAPAPAPEPVVEKKVEEIRRDIFFVINSNKIRPAEDAKIKEVVDYMNQYPESKVSITGYADAGTGNHYINDRIAAKRAAAVVWMLEKKYGIDSSRISSDSKGARVQPFADNDSNRVSIMIAK